ncbi:MAG TPA: ABC transporter ATP-binding protein [Gemmatimonadales bacterium]|nr:ABC transporter ATP-binding protein [Gemmatimonadales bacterium]
MNLSARGATVRYPGAAAEALADADLTLAAGELVAVVGPNGGGKTTLVRALLNLAPLARGSVTLNGRPIQDWRRGELARHAALVPQREDTPFSWRVSELVGFGRYARRGPLEAMGADDTAAVERALTRCDVAEFRERRIETLSGGEWQRVRIARALAQEPRLLVLDEPTASLDLGHEMELFELVRRLVADGLAALVVTHDLNLAARYADRMLLLDGGRIAASGPPEAVMQAELLSRVFRWPVAVMPLVGGPPQVLALRPGQDRPRYS